VITVIVPVYLEREQLPGCLDCVVPQAAEVGAEVIVVDGGSDDGTVDIASRRRGARLIHAARGRGIQMNAGARAARGSLLVFLPADTRLPEGALRRLDRIDRGGAPRAGGFRQRFDSPRRFLRAISRLHNLRARVTGVCYGDQVPFVRRELFEELEGFREDLPMEDVEFGARLTRRVRPHLLELYASTSARRFDHGGDLRGTVIAALLLLVRGLTGRVFASRTFFEPIR
jgi:rSAM/selenodomain-associated transferase 2